MRRSSKRVENVRLINKIKVYLAGLGAGPSRHTHIHMQKHTRTVRIFISLTVGMSIGALALMAVDSQSFSEGPFSLASYSNLSSTEKITGDISISDTHKFQQIHIATSSVSAGSIEQLAAVSGLANAGELNYHFVVFNGIDGVDGKICATEKWLKQQRNLSGLNQQDNPRTIKICVITGSIFTTPTDCQVKRTAALVESLARKLGIPTSSIQYPVSWQL